MIIKIRIIKYDDEALCHNIGVTRDQSHHISKLNVNLESVFNKFLYVLIIIDIC